jgi:hypothetical protein
VVCAKVERGGLRTARQNPFPLPRGPRQSQRSQRAGG